jgi:hypothetical protein
MLAAVKAAAGDSLIAIAPPGSPHHCAGEKTRRGDDECRMPRSDLP